MKLKLYRSSSEPVRVDKTEYLKFVVELNGTIKNATSIVNPSIIINVKYNTINVQKNVVDDDSLRVVDNENKQITYDSDTFTYFQCNYAYIEELHRYYFITDIICVTNELFQINMQCDVLMSYKEQLKKLDAYVTRNEFSTNYNLVDTELDMTNEPDIQVIEIPNNLFDLDSNTAKYYVTTLVSFGGE